MQVEEEKEGKEQEMKEYAKEEEEWNQENVNDYGGVNDSIH